LSEGSRGVFWPAHCSSGPGTAIGSADIYPTRTLTATHTVMQLPSL
jgi:hypothetical protein